MTSAAFSNAGGTPAEIKRWGAAAAVVVAAHVTAVAGYILLHEPASPAGGTPVVLVEMTAVPRAPQIESIDIPEEKPAEQSARAPEVVNPPDEKPPPDPPQPSQVTVATPPPPKPQPKPKKPPAPRTVAVARAPNPAEVPSVASSTVGVAASRAAQATWKSLMAAHLERFKRNLSGSQAHGIVRLSFTVDRNRHVLNRRIAQSSGFRELDDEALALLLRAQPLPAFPPGMTQDRKDVNTSLTLAR